MIFKNGIILRRRIAVVILQLNAIPDPQLDPGLEEGSARKDVTGSNDKMGMWTIDEMKV